MPCRFGGGAGGPGGNPKAALGGMGLLILGTGALWTFNNALFNGTKRAWSHATTMMNRHQAETIHS